MTDDTPAFPMIRDMRHSPDFDYHEGMTLRDWFAGMALQGLLASFGEHEQLPDDPLLLSKDMYKVADAMMKARGK